MARVYNNSETALLVSKQLLDRDLSRKAGWENEVCSAGQACLPGGVSGSACVDEGVEYADSEDALVGPLAVRRGERLVHADADF